MDASDVMTPVPASGTLEQHPAFRLYYLVAGHEQSGKLTLKSSSAIYELYFKKGVPEAVVSGVPGESLGAFLLGQGVLAREQLEEAARSAREYGGDPLNALLAKGMLNPADAFRHISALALGLIPRALTLTRGTFTFHPGVPGPSTSMPLGDRWGLACTAARSIPAPRYREWLGANIEKAVLKRGGLVELPDLKLSPQERRVTPYFDGVQPLSNLCAAFPAEADTLLRVAYLLWAFEVVVFADGASPPASPASSGGDTKPAGSGTNGGATFAAAGPGSGAKAPGASGAGTAGGAPRAPGAPDKPGGQAAGPAAATGAAAKPSAPVANASGSAAANSASAKPSASGPQAGGAAAAGGSPGKPGGPGAHPAAGGAAGKPNDPGAPKTGAVAAGGTSAQPRGPGSSPAHPAAAGSAAAKPGAQTGPAAKPIASGAAAARPAPAASASGAKPGTPSPTAAKPPASAPMAKAAPPEVKPAAPPAAEDPSLPGNDPEKLKTFALSVPAQTHFQILGLPDNANGPQVKAAYFKRAKHFHPDTLPPGAGPELIKLKSDIFAAVNEAYRVLGDDTLRAAYLQELKAGDAANEEVDVSAYFESEVAFRKACAAIKSARNEEGLKLLEEAIRLNPEEGEFKAWLGWARFLVASDKKQAKTTSLNEIETAIKMSPKCAQAPYFAGQICKLTGDGASATKWFKKTLELNPNHIDAQREIRLAARK